jgi:hypothetical protein
MLHIESGWTCLRTTRRQVQTERYDGVFRPEFVVRKGHASDASGFGPFNPLISEV